MSGRADLERIREMEETVWDADHGWLPDMLERDIAGPGDPCVVVVAEVEDQVVCAAWMRCHEGTDFVSLWGGSTLKEWRGRGIYRATVSYRARLAVDRGFRLVRVDASDASSADPDQAGPGGDRDDDALRVGAPGRLTGGCPVESAWERAGRRAARLGGARR
ncbi:hypothetical protein ACFQX6_05790 [Streptosporangium lutulentum]